MSGVQGCLGEHKRGILKLRKKVTGSSEKSVSHEMDIQKNSDATRKMEKQRKIDEQNRNAQMDAVHDDLDSKVNEKPSVDVEMLARDSFLEGWRCQSLPRGCQGRPAGRVGPLGEDQGRSAPTHLCVAKRSHDQCVDTLGFHLYLQQ